MKDFAGNELNINDEIIFIYSNTTGGKRLMKGIIEKVEKGCAYIKGMNYGCYDSNPESTKRWSCSDGYTNQVKVKGSSIYKINKDYDYECNI